MNKEKFIKAHGLHQEWLADNSKGERFEWHGSFNFSFIEFFFKINLSSADLSYANLSSANLSSANLRSANLSSANLRSADFDFSSGITFKCSSFDFKADLRLAAQMAYHFCKIDFGDCQEALEAQSFLIDLANKFHRVNECGRIE